MLTSTAETAHKHDDCVVIEEPLEIRLVLGPDEDRSTEPFSITMRTPGDDFELAAGLLFTEGVLTSANQIRAISHFGRPAAPGTTSNTVRVELAPDVSVDLSRLRRHVASTSSCGVCGKASLDSLHVDGIAPLDTAQPTISNEMLRSLPNSLRAHQPIFQQTGGVHGAGLFDSTGTLIDVREDVGRHNAVDKLIGRQFLTKELPLADHILIISGRASFEIAQKTLVAGIPILVAVGAPSSLAVQMAEQYGMTLVGFASEERFNIYTQPERVR